MAVAEHVSYAYGFRSIAVISGVGVRSYYAKLGYAMHAGPGEYMIKSLSSEHHLLPLSVFGFEHRPEVLMTPVSALTVPTEHLPKVSSAPCDRE